MKYKIFLVVFILSLISSVVLSTNSATGICEPGGGCELVNNSNYGSTLGIKNSVYGVFIFAFMIALTIWHMRNPSRHTRNLLHAMIILGSAIAIYFLYLQFFVIKLFCNFCLVVDFGLLAALVLMFWFWEH